MPSTADAVKAVVSSVYAAERGYFFTAVIEGCRMTGWNPTGQSAEDALSYAMVRVLEKAGEYDPSFGTSIRGWAYREAMWAASKWARKAKRESRESAKFVDIAFVGEDFCYRKSEESLARGASAKYDSHHGMDFGLADQSGYAHLLTKRDIEAFSSLDEDVREVPSGVTSQQYTWKNYELRCAVTAKFAFLNSDECQYGSEVVLSFHSASPVGGRVWDVDLGKGTIVIKNGRFAQTYRISDVKAIKAGSVRSVRRTVRMANA